MGFLSWMSNRQPDSEAGEAASQPVVQPAAQLAVTFGMASEVGPRLKNDDFVAVSRLRGMAAIADGIGGAPYGDAMSCIGVNSAVRHFELTGSLHDAFREADEDASLVSEMLGSPGCGSTLLLAALEHEDRQVRFLWAGDSVAYRLRGQDLILLTPPGRSYGNALSSAIGYKCSAIPREIAYDILPGDRLLLCTDGVWEYLEDDEIASVLKVSDSAPWTAHELARRAAEVGNDNATAVVAFVLEDAEETPTIKEGE